MAKGPKNPSGGGGEGGRGPDLDKLNEKAGRFANEALRHVGDAMERISRFTKTLLENLKQVVSWIGEKAEKAFESYVVGAKKTVTATEAMSGAAKKATDDMKKVGLAGEVVGGIFAGVVLGAFKKVAEFAANVLAPNMEGITGGLGKSTEAAERMEIATRRLALQIELGQQKAMGPLRNVLASLYERVTDLNPEIVRKAAAWGQVASIGAKVAATLAGVTAVIANFGPLIGLAVKGVQMFGEKIGSTALKQAKSLGDVLSWLSVAGIAAVKDGFTSLALVIGRFLLGPGGALILLAGLIATLIYRTTQWGEKNRDAAKSLRESLQEMKNGSSALRELANAYELLLDKISLRQRAAREELEVQRLLARGDVMGAAHIREQLELEERRIQKRQELLEEQKRQKEFVKSGLITQEDADRHLKDVERAQALEDERQAYERLMRAEGDRQDMLSRTLELLSRERQLLQEKRDIVDADKAAALEALQSELELAQMRGASGKETLALQEQITAGLAEQKERRIEQIDLERRAVKEEIERRKVALEQTKAAFGVALEAEKEAATIRKRADQLFRVKRGLEEKERTEGLTSTERGRLGRVAFEWAAAEDEAKELELKAAPTQEQKRLLEDQQSALDQLESKERGLEAMRQRELADRRELVELEKERVRLANERTGLENAAQDATMRRKDLQNPSGAKDRREREVRRILGQFRGYGRFGPEARGSGERLDEADSQLERAEQFARETGDEHSLKKILKLREQIAKKRVEENQKAQDSVKRQSEEVEKAIDRARSPLGQMVKITEGIGKNIKSWIGPIDEATRKLAAYREEYERTGRVVEGFSIGNGGNGQPLTLGPAGSGV